MPKSKITLPNRKLLTKKVKFKLGGRSSTKSALDLTNDELVAIVNDPNAGRSRPKAQQVLARRGVAVTA